MAAPDLRSPDALARAVEEAAGHYRQGRLDDADRLVSRVLKAAPDWFDALHLCGLIKLETGKAALAQTLLAKALRLNPAAVPVMIGLARALSALQRDDEALALIDRALTLAPAAFEAVNARGNVLLKLGRADEAAAAFERVLAIEPRFLGARGNLGVALAQLGRFAEALAQYDALLAAQPPHPELLVNRGNVLTSLGRLDEAVAAFDAALAQRGDYVKARLGRGGALAALNRHQEALQEFGRVTDKAHADARHNEALSLLTLGDYRRGFERYEARWLRSGMARRRSTGKPLWLGEYPLVRKTVLVQAEQGLGDTIQFARYVPMLAKAGARVVLEVQRELKSLLSRLAGVTEVIGRGEALPAFDVHCPAGSLPLAFRTELATVPATVPYLAADPARLAHWRDRLAALPAPRIALVWSGSADHANDRNRSIALARLRPLFEGRDRGSFISLQRDVRADDQPVLATLPQVTALGDDLADFDDTAAVLAACDLLIAVDTAVVHLAGALNRPVWVLLPFQPDWRWLLDRDDSPWYPSARLFRQPRPGDWDSVVGGVAAALAAGP